MSYHTKMTKPLPIVFALAMTLASASSQAGVLVSLLKLTGLDVLIAPLANTTGLALDNDIQSLDTLLATLLNSPATLPLEMSSAEQSKLAAMDLSEADFAALQLFADEAPVAVVVARQANDQPAVAVRPELNPRYQGGQIQIAKLSCSDKDQDGVCDQEDQCLNTPDGVVTMDNGCHLDGPVSLRLDGVVFLPASATLTSAAEFELQRAVALLKQNPGYRVLVAGHTDDQGSADSNRRLSQARAAAVVQFLQSQGINKDRLKTKGFGEAQPIADNSGEVGRAKNRRVELQLIEMGAAG
jgi:OOP family OmpA-OmpF porin